MITILKKQQQQKISLIEAAGGRGERHVYFYIFFSLMETFCFKKISPATSCKYNFCFLLLFFSSGLYIYVHRYLRNQQK